MTKNKLPKVGDKVVFAVFGSFEHLKGYYRGTVLAIGVTHTGHSCNPQEAAIVAWEESDIDGYRAAHVDACPLYRLGER